MRLSILLILFMFLQHASAQTEQINVYTMDFDQLSKVKIVSATKTEQEIDEIASTIKVITSKEIFEKGYFTIEEMLSDLPGFQFRNIMGMNSYVFQRGIPNQNNLTLILIDGVQVNELNSGGFYGGGQYNLSNIERVEVVYGPSSVAWGTNAITGIINIITKKAKGNTGEISALAGSFKTTMSDASLNLTNKKSDRSIRLSGMVKQSEKANLRGTMGDNNWTDLMDNTETDYNFGLKAQLGSLSIGTNCQQKQSTTATMQKSIGTNYRDFGTLWNIRFINSYIKYEKPLSGKSQFTSLLYNRNATVLPNSVYYVLDSAQVGYYRPNNLTGLENIINYNYSKTISATGGLVFEYEELSNGASQTHSNSEFTKPPTPLRPQMQNNYLASAYIEPRVALLSNLYLSAGLRFDHSSIYKQLLTPRAGISYASKQVTARLSYAEAFRSPKPWDYTDGLGNPNLMPEKMKSGEASLSLQADKTIKIEAIAYRNKLINGIVKETLNNGYRWANTGEISTTGAEFVVAANYEKFRPYLNITYTNSIDENKTNVAEISPLTANAGISYNMLKNIDLNLRANYRSKCENPKTISATSSKYIDSYIVFHGTISYTSPKGYYFQLISKNLLDHEYYHTSNRSPERYRQAQRSLMIKFGHSFKL